MKILYINNIRFPTEKAHGIQIMKMCEAFAENGVNVSLVVPSRKNNIKENAFSYYGVRDFFSLKYIPVFDAISFFRGSRFGFYVQAMNFIWVLRKENISSDTVIITRNPEVAWLCGRRGNKVFYDAHNFPSRRAWLFKKILKNISGVIANSRGTADAFHNAGFKNILVAPNAVDLAQFDNAKLKTREDLGLPAGRIVMYVGHLYKWKGVDVIIETAKNSKSKNIVFVFVGGTDGDLDRYRAKTKNMTNVVFLGRRPHKEIPALIKSANALLLPNIPTTKESELYTSPIKMFEYMASGVPIIASDLPSIGEVLNNDNSFLVQPNNPALLADTIKEVFNFESLSEKVKEKVLKARNDVIKYSWTERVKKIVKFIKKG